jgi:hypothetical protein
MADAVDIYFEQQSLRQEGKMDCGLHVFAKLADFSQEEILRDLPDAREGKTVGEWEAYLTAKLAPRGLKPKRYQPGECHPRPCAHLVIAGTPHWVYEAENGGIHDPSESAQFMPPRLLKLEHCGNLELTIALEQC